MCRRCEAVHQAFNLDKPAARGGTAGSGFAQQFQSLRKLPTVIDENGGRNLASITQKLSSMEDIVVSEVLLATDQGRITVFNLPDRPGVCSRVFQAVAAGSIVVEM